MFPQKFDVLKFENRVRELMIEAIEPITAEQLNVAVQLTECKKEQ